MKSFRHYILLVLSAVSLILTSCLDDRLYDPDDLVIGDGFGDMNVSVSFRDLDPALDSRAAGNAVSKVESLWVVLYNIVDGNPVFYKKFLASSLSDYKVNQTGNAAEPGDVETGSNLGPTGEKTPKATFKLTDIPYGRYQLYAVANVPGLSDADCDTPETMKKMTFDWQTDVSKNNAMFGYFTRDDAKTSQGFNAPVIVLNKTSINLHSWIKRLVSKVTVSFDARELNESVRIFVKSVTIHDIPKTCYLGQDNVPTENDLIANGEEFKYYTTATEDNSQHEKWGIILSRGKEYNLQGAVNHSEEDDALYFFENMQGNYPGEKDYLKVQIPDEVGTAIDKIEDGPDYKDRKLAGTYIEVVGYYESKNKDKLTSGPIKYRFMLGKDVTYNYDAERNFHYKLTLKFRGWANEADWHISYREHTPTLLVPDSYYISYLYGQTLDFPARVLTGDESVKTYTVKAEIIENNWSPSNVTDLQQPAQFIGPQTDINGFAWNKPAYDNIYGKGVNYVGFLSLRENEGDVIGNNIKNPDPNGYGTVADAWLKKYYEDNKIAYNEYPLNGSNAKYDEVDKSLSLTIPMYTRQKEMVPETDFTGNNPFNCYARTAKVRFTLWDKNGQQVTFKDKDGNDANFQESTIIQVPRIENPKAIYRDENNNDPFDIKLMYLKNAGESTYSKYKSDGPWRASIMCQTEDFIKLTALDGAIVERGSSDEYIHGSTDEYIEFQYEPKSTCPGRTRCGIIKVEYNDYNCVHLIFVRQGYHQGVFLGDANWSCYNVYAAANPTDRKTLAPGDNIAEAEVALTRSPLSVGSFLKRCQYNYSIREQNNETYGWLKSITDVELSVAYVDANKKQATRSETPKWSDIQGYGWTNFYPYTNAQRTNKRWATKWTAVGGFQDGETFKVPTAANFKALLNNCKFGYGIAYADGATATAETFTMANGFTDYNNVGSESPNGIRACVVYDESDGKNILFPLSALGQARRSRTGAVASSSWGDMPFPTDPGAGTISYGGLRMVLGGTANQHRPLTYDIYRTPGACYWINEPVLTDQKANNFGINCPDYASWDINYLTIVFNPYAHNSLGGWDDSNKEYNNNIPNYNSSGQITSYTRVSATNCSDALPIKLIYTN